MQIIFQTIPNYRVKNRKKLGKLRLCKLRLKDDLSGILICACIGHSCCKSCAHTMFWAFHVTWNFWICYYHGIWCSWNTGNPALQVVSLEWIESSFHLEVEDVNSFMWYDCIDLASGSQILRNKYSKARRKRWLIHMLDWIIIRHLFHYNEDMLENILTVDLKTSLQYSMTSWNMEWLGLYFSLRHSYDWLWGIHWVTKRVLLEFR